MKTCRDGAPVLTNYATENVWRINDWQMGVTEGGSSGSPLFNENGHLIGQLWRGSAACSGTNDNGGYDEYGRFDVSWDAGTTVATRLREWLDPSNTGEVIIDQFENLDSINIFSIKKAGRKKAILVDPTTQLSPVFLANS